MNTKVLLNNKQLNNVYKYMYTVMVLLILQISRFLISGGCSLDQSLQNEKLVIKYIMNILLSQCMGRSKIFTEVSVKPGWIPT